MNRSTSVPDSTAGPSLNAFKAGKLQAMLLFGVVTVTAVWLYEANCIAVSIVDQYAYPIMLAAFGGSLIAMWVRPQHWMIALKVSFLTLLSYIVTYAQVLLYSPSETINLYDAATFPQWFPLRKCCSIYVFGEENCRIYFDRGVFFPRWLLHPGFMSSNRFIWQIAVFNFAAHGAIAPTLYRGIIGNYDFAGKFDSHKSLCRCDDDRGQY
jgi:hypothetical protein